MYLEHNIDADIICLISFTWSTCSFFSTSKFLLSDLCRISTLFISHSFSLSFFGVPDFSASLFVIYLQSYFIRRCSVVHTVLTGPCVIVTVYTLMTWIHPVRMSGEVTWHWVFWCSGRLWDVLHWTELITAHNDMEDYLRLMEEKSVQQSAFKSPHFSHIDVHLSE